MIKLKHLLDLADAYKQALGIEDKTVSNRVFGDSKKLTSLRDGWDITTSRFNEALIWFSANWPENANWPVDVPRPYVEQSA